MHFYLYKITNTLNGKIYVGVHKTNDLNDGYMGSGKIIRSAISKHGISNFSKDILETFENAKAMYAREAEVVNEEFLDRPDVYNLRRGGYGGFDYINANELSYKGYTSVRDKNRKITPFKGDDRHKEILELAKNGFNIMVSDPAKKSLWLDSIKMGRSKSTYNFSDTSHMSIESAIFKKKNTFALIGHQKGEKNSQHGTMWITNGVENKKINKTHSIPEGFRKGRVQAR